MDNINDMNDMNEINFINNQINNEIPDLINEEINENSYLDDNSKKIDCGIFKAYDTALKN